MGRYLFVVAMLVHLLSIYYISYLYPYVLNFIKTMWRNEEKIVFLDPKN